MMITMERIYKVAVDKTKFIWEIKYTRRLEEEGQQSYGTPHASNHAIAMMDTIPQ